MRLVAGQGRECGVRGMARQAQLAGQRESCAIRPGGGHREPAGGHDDAAGCERAAGGVDLPVRTHSREACEAGAPAEVDAARACGAHEPIAHVARLVRGGEPLAGVRFEGQGQRQVVLEEAAHVGQRPRSQQAPEYGGRRVGDEPLGLDGRRQDIAPAAAADQDLPAAIGRALEDHHGRRPLGREQGGDEACGPGADHDDGIYLKNSSTGTTRSGPSLRAAMPGSITLRSPTTTTAMRSPRM